MRSVGAALWSALALCLLLAASCGGDAGDAPAAEGEALRIGLLLNFSGSSTRSEERRQGFELAIEHINDGGGVLGRPVEMVTADSTLDPEVAVEAARRLIEDEGIHALVGPSSSANSLRVVTEVTGPAGIPTISPSATSPELTGVDDRDFFFRTALSDRAQGPVLARVTRERGFDNVAMIYRDDSWGRGLADSFAQAWEGGLQSVAVEGGRTSYLDDLRAISGSGAQALVVITFNTEGVVIILEALASGLYDQFALGDAMVGDEVLEGLGDDFEGGMFGTLPGRHPGGDSTSAWESAYGAEHGGQPQAAYVREAYDAAIAIALAAQAAGSLDGAAIRDRLRLVGGGPGVRAIAGADGIAAALRALSEGRQVDYDGAAVSMDWDENGDLLSGHIGVWELTEAGEVRELEVVAFGE